MTLTAHYREPLSTMDTTRPLPLHLAKLPPCAHCGGTQWAWHTEQRCWLCQCYWFPERRPRYQRAPRAEKPAQTPLPIPAPGAVMFMCNLKARPGNRCHAVVHGDEAWWTNM